VDSNTIAIVSFTILAIAFLAAFVFVIHTLWLLTKAIKECEKYDKMHFKVPSEVRKTMPKRSVEPGVYYPTEDETLSQLNNMAEDMRAGMANPYRAWGIYDADGEE